MPRPIIMRTTRDLRAWHWMRNRHYRGLENAFRIAAENWEEQWPGKRCRAYRNKSNAARTKADFHLSCVIALNDCPDCLATTAEQDCAQ